VPPKAAARQLLQKAQQLPWPRTAPTYDRLPKRAVTANFRSRFMKPKFARLADYVDAEQAAGRYAFAARDAQAALGVSDIALQTAARRLAAKKRIVSPLRGFFVIVPIEYRAAGAPPASWFIHALMAHRGRPYYVGLLSAAALYGAAHQAPQELQVITDRHMRPITVGRVRIRFFYKKDLAQTKSVTSKTDTGHTLMSSPEVTALELVRYPHSAGSLSAVATVRRRVQRNRQRAHRARRVIPRAFVTAWREHAPWRPTRQVLSRERHDGAVHVDVIDEDARIHDE
jgi:predicted transcriptional regulator of viral defense system